MNRFSKWLLLALCVTSLLLVPAFAQKTSGTINGVVYDPSGAVVPGVSVTITNTGTGASRTVTTDAQGVYSAPELEPGIYKVVAKSSNFKESTVNGAEVHVSSITNVDVKLEVGSASEQVEVLANTIQVQTDSAALGEVIDSTQVRELPLNGRSFVQLTQLAPGVSGANNFDSKNKGLQGGVDFSVNGNPTTNNLFLVDGANNNDVGSNRTILVYPAIESIAEFKMLRNSYGPEYGQASGAVINIVTKGGTNQFHGSAFYYGRNDAVAAAEYFAARQHTKDVLRRNDYGFTIGGPAIKDRLFFFYSQEWNKEKRGLTRSSCVPTVEELSGDFSADAAAVAAGGVSNCNAPLPNFVGLPDVDPTNQYRLLSVDPAGRLLLDKYPSPNIVPTTPGGSNWAASEGSQLNWRQESGRVDFNINKSNTVMFRYTQDTWTNPSPTGGVYWGDDFFPALTGNWAQPSKMIVGKVTSTIGGHIVNDAEFAYSNNRINITTGGTNPGLQQQISDAIIPLYPSNLATKTAPASIPTIWGGFNQYGSGQNYWTIAPWNNALDIYTFRDDVSWVKGNHTIKFGAFIGRDAKDEDNGASSTERPTFGTADWDTNHPTGNQLANVLVPGAVWGLSEISTNVRDLLRWRDYEFYVGDSWKVRRNITVDLGVRYSLLYSPYHPDGQMSNFAPALYDPTKPASDACNGLVIVPGTDPCGDANAKFGTTYSAGVDGPNKHLRDQNYHLFAPRLGIAWDLRGDGKSALRMGLGQFYQRERVSPSNGLTANAPFAVNGGLSRALGGSEQIAGGGAASPTGGANPNSDVPNSWQWNISFEQSLARDTALQVGYVGNKSTHLTSNYDINAVPSSATSDCTLGGTDFGVIPSWQCVAFIGDANAQKPFRAFPNFQAINYFDRNGDSTYHSLQVLFKTRYKRSQFTGAYTWSHSISNVQLDNSSGGAGAQNYLDFTRPELDRGNSPINRPHIFVANATFFLPDLKASNSFVQGALGGWELGVITSAASGASHTVYQNGISEDANFRAGGGLGLQSLIGTGYNEPLRPLITGVSCDSDRSGNQIYNPAAFTLIGYQIGTIPSNMEPRGYCPGPRQINTDFSLNKNFKVRERVNVQFRIDFFNLFNHPNFRGDQVFGYTPSSGVNCGPADPGTGLYAPCSPVNNIITRENPTNQFGQSSQTTTRSGREMQYGLKISF